MKKYCLSKCAKRKMSEIGEAVLGTIAVVIIVAIFVGALVGVAWLIGSIFMYFGVEARDAGELGIGYIAILTIGSAIVLWISDTIIKPTAKYLTTFVKNRYEGKAIHCPLFEVCEDDSNE